MSQLIQLIYCSVADHPFSSEELADLLTEARITNAQYGITGILLYSDGAFFQILEGESEIVDKLFARIMGDKRHRRLTIIVHEPISRRSFGDWTMGYAGITGQEADAILGMNDFFGKGESLARLSSGRAKKLLAAFKHGRWRGRIRGAETPSDRAVQTGAPVRLSSPVILPAQAGTATALPLRTWYSFAYQPIIHATTGTIFSYEALVRGLKNESAREILQQVSPAEMHRFDEQSRTLAIEIAAHLGLATRLNLNFLPLSTQSSSTAITSILATAERCQINPEQIVLEILEREIIYDFDSFNAEINPYRRSGLIFAIDDFGAGYSGLNLLAEFQPALIKLDMHLVHGIERNGPRQAIVRGILRTCLDLGIDIIAEGVETSEEYGWLHTEGIELFQGLLFARPEFEQLPKTFHLPDRR